MARADERGEARESASREGRDGPPKAAVESVGEVVAAVMFRRHS
ncbi:hypothetical protein [Haloarchaeobius sp. DFWS5]